MDKDNQKKFRNKVDSNENSLIHLEKESDTITDHISIPDDCTISSNNNTSRKQQAEQKRIQNESVCSKTITEPKKQVQYYDSTVPRKELSEWISSQGLVHVSFNIS